VAAVVKGSRKGAKPQSKKGATTNCTNDTNLKEPHSWLTFVCFASFVVPSSVAAKRRAGFFVVHDGG
jgi:hypothetical protein